MPGDTEGDAEGAVLQFLDARDLAAQQQYCLPELGDHQQALTFFDGISQPQVEAFGAQVVDDRAHAETLAAGRHVQSHGRERPADTRGVTSLDESLCFQSGFGVQRRGLSIIIRTSLLGFLGCYRRRKGVLNRLNYDVQ